MECSFDMNAFPYEPTEPATSDGTETGECRHDHGPTPEIPRYTPQQLELAAQMCQAMGDPTRLRLLLWLAQREVCVSELVELEQAKLSSISARLQQLHAARLVNRRRQAKHIFYSLADEHVRNLLLNVLNHASEPGDS